MPDHVPVDFRPGERKASIVRKVLERDGRIDAVDAWDIYDIDRLALPIKELRDGGMVIDCDKRGGQRGKALYIWRRPKEGVWKPDKVEAAGYPPMRCRGCGETRDLRNIQSTVDPRWFFVRCGTCGGKIADRLG